MNDICKVKTTPHLPHGTGEIKRVNKSHIFPSIPLKQIYNYNTAHQLYSRTASNTSLWSYTSGGKNPANACFHSSIGFLLRKIIIALIQALKYVRCTHTWNIFYKYWLHACNYLPVHNIGREAHYITSAGYYILRTVIPLPAKATLLSGQISDALR